MLGLDRGGVTSVNRREFIAGLSSTALPVGAARGQQKKTPLIGYLAVGSKVATERYRSGLAVGMRELGYIEGRNYVFDDLYADGDLSRLPMLAKQLVDREPNVILPGSMPAVIAIKKLTNKIPIVSEALTDPVGFGVAGSYAHPAAM